MGILFQNKEPKIIFGKHLRIVQQSLSGSLGQTMAQAHYDRVVADGGVLPIGVAGLASVLNSIAAAYNVSTTAAFNAAVPVFLDPHYTGYKLGTGSGTTLGQAARTVYAINPSADVTQATATSQPLLLAHSGVNYYASNAATIGNSCSTPDAVINRITDNFDIVHCIGGWESGRAGNINKSGAYSVYILTSGIVRFQLVFATVATNYDSTITPTTGANWVRVTRDKVSGEIKFYQSAQSVSTALNAITWSQLGTTVVGSTASCDSSSNSLHINNAAVQSSLFRCYRATISNSIGGAPVVDFNPASYNASTSQTQWTSTTGEVWTIDTGTATTGYKGVLVDRTKLIFDRTDDFMSSTLTAGLISVLNSDHGFGFCAKRYTLPNNEFVLTLGGDYTANNSIQIVMNFWDGSKIGNWNKGTVSANRDSAGTYRDGNAFSYVDNIVYGGTSTQLVNSTANSGNYFNNTTNKPAIVSGSLEIGKSVYGNLNGELSTLVIVQDGTKYSQLNTIVRSLNNDFAL